MVEVEPDPDLEAEPEPEPALVPVPLNDVVGLVLLVGAMPTTAILPVFVALLTSKTLRIGLPLMGSEVATR